MKLKEAKSVCKDRSKWKEVISAYPNGKPAFRYVCVYNIPQIEITTLLTITELVKIS
jgi:hypothetical protein